MADLSSVELAHLVLSIIAVSVPGGHLLSDKTKQFWLLAVTVHTHYRHLLLLLNSEADAHFAVLQRLSWPSK